MTVKERSRLYILLADILSYPQPGLNEKVKVTIEILVSESMPEAAAELGQFLKFSESQPLGGLEEIYTGTFDLNPLCTPYVGHYLFGENHKRSEFLVRLKEDFDVYGFTAEGEMPDHLSILLRFLALLEEDYPTHSFIRECLVPALSEMEAKPKEGNPYHHVIRALALTFEKELESDVAGGPDD